MRILQLIDSLHGGGAERLAVNYANGLSAIVETSYLCATREEGILKGTIHEAVTYFFLDKKRTFDLRAISRLHNYVKEHKIDIIHAHSTSYFLATLVKWRHRKLKIVWHDHYGNSEFLNERPHRILKVCSRYFAQIFSVNTSLMEWSKKHLSTKRVSFLPNFATLSDVGPSTKMHGDDGKRIICLANLRPQKDHQNLIEAFADVVRTYPEWTLHLVGNDLNDAYSSRLKQSINDKKLSNHVYLYGSRPDIGYILSQCDIGVLSSKSEGLPIALLEYGLAALAVVITNVGECGKVITNDSSGLLIEPENPVELQEAIKRLISDERLRRVMSGNLKNKIEDEYSSKAILTQVADTYQNILE